MKQIVKFPLDNGDSVLIEVDEPSEDDRISLRNRVVKTAQQTLDASLDKVGPTINSVIAKVQTLNQPIDEVEIKFGIKMSAELGAVVAAGNAEVNYEITLKWNRGSKNAHTS